MRIWLIALCVLLQACGTHDHVETASTSGSEATVERTTPLRLERVVPGPYVVEVRGGCTQGPDSCEARGACVAAPVDCGGPGDRLKISVHWASSDDIDVYVTDRLGDSVSFLRPTSLTGARMIAPPGRSCIPSQTAGDEAVAYSGPHVTLGNYSVVLQHFGSCMSGLGVVEVDITMSAGGRYLTTYRASLAAQDRQEVLVLGIAD